MGKSIEVTLPTEDIRKLINLRLNDFIKKKIYAKRIELNAINEGIEYEIRANIKREYCYLIRAFFEKDNMRDDIDYYNRFLNGIDAELMANIYEAVTELTSCKDIELTNQLEYGYYGRSFGRRQKEKYKATHHRKPSTDLDKLKRKTRNRINQTEIELDILPTEDMELTMALLIDNIDFYYPTKEDKRKCIRALRKDISTFMTSEYKNEKGAGELQGLIYKNFYGKSMNEIKDELRKNNIKVINNSLDETFNNDHLRYKLAFLSAINEIIEGPKRSETELRLFAATITKIGQKDFEEKYGKKPMASLVEGQDKQLPLDSIMTGPVRKRTE